MDKNLPQRSQSTQSDYSEETLVHLSDAEHARRRPDMHIGEAGKVGLHRMVFNLVDDSLEQASYGDVRNIEVTINKDGSASVANDGQGISVKRDRQMSAAEGREITVLEVVMTKMFIGPGTRYHRGYPESEWRPPGMDR